jgi:hypothetical protein
VPDTGAVPAPLLQANLAAASAGSRWESAAAAEAFAGAGPGSAPLLPDGILGRTYHRVDGEYRHDPARTYAPETGEIFETITVDGETITAQNAAGGQLTGAEAEAVRDIFDGFWDLF